MHRHRTRHQPCFLAVSAKGDLKLRRDLAWLSPLAGLSLCATGGSMGAPLSSGRTRMDAVKQMFLAYRDRTDSLAACGCAEQQPTQLGLLQFDHKIDVLLEPTPFLCAPCSHTHMFMFCQHPRCCVHGRYECPSLCDGLVQFAFSAERSLKECLTSYRTGVALTSILPSSRRVASSPPSSTAIPPTRQTCASSC